MTPRLSDPMIVVLFFLGGGFIGGAIARIGRRSRDEIRRRTEDAAFFATALGIVIYLAALALIRLR